MLYSDVINNNFHLLLPKKSKYTINDAKNLLKLNRFDLKTIRFIIICTAVYHNTDYSKVFGDQQQFLLTMLFK